MKNIYRLTRKGGVKIVEKVDSQVVDTWWKQWFEHKDETAANQLIEHYMYLVHFHVDRVASYIPEQFDRNELKSLGLYGLFDALNKYDPERNNKFDTYATIRIRGSIMDGLRREDWLPRSLRDQAKKIDQVTDELKQRLMRTPNAKDIAEELGKTEEEIEEIVANTMFANVISLDTAYVQQDEDDTTELIGNVEDENAVLPDDMTFQAESKRELIESIKKLNETEQLVISLFYEKELTLTEIGKILDLTTSRISQIHKRAIFKLKGILKKLSSST